MPMVLASNSLSAYCFGGVFDIEDDEENLAGNFFNDFYQLDLEKMMWRNISLIGKRDKDGKIRRKKNKDDEG